MNTSWVIEKSKITLNDGIGFVELLSIDGEDCTPAIAARTSFDGDVYNDDVRNERLISYLLRNDHGTPFEFLNTKWRIKLPIFIMRQLVRHRIASINEWSGRYIELDPEFYTPINWRIPANDNKQGSIYEPQENSWDETNYQILQDSYTRSYGEYQLLLDRGVAKEQARMVLPLGLYTQIMWNINFRSLSNFLKLRMDSHAQFEIQEYAHAIFELLAKRVPFLASILSDDIELSSLIKNLRNKFAKDPKKLLHHLDKLLKGN